MNPSVSMIQQAITDAGFPLGGVDGIWGRKSIAATKLYQKANGLHVDGVVGPDTLGALGLSSTALDFSTPPVWYLEARRKMGLHEVLNNAELKKYLKSDGHTLGDPAKLPWCGDFVETCIALTLPQEEMVPNPYYALNWLKFGQELKVPAIGAILVFHRPEGGHVGFYAGEREDAYHVLGGNQSNRVSAAWVSKERWKGTRWPLTAPLPTTGRVASSAGGKLSTNEA